MDKLVQTSKVNNVPAARFNCWYETNKLQNEKKGKSGLEHNMTRQIANIVVGVNGDNSADARNYLINNILAIVNSPLHTPRINPLLVSLHL